MCKARNLRAIAGRPWSDVGRGFAVAMTSGKVCPRILGERKF